MMFFLKETASYDRFSDKGNYAKTIEGVLAYKKSCFAMTKYTTLSIPNALMPATLNICVFILTGCYYSGLQLRNDFFDGSG